NTEVQKMAEKFLFVNMWCIRLFYVLFIVSTEIITIAHGHFDKEEQTLTLLISFDGFRYDYLSKVSKEGNFKKLQEKGTTVKDGVFNSFITKTLPNHLTIVTGLHEETHGMVANSYYDPNLKEKFDIQDPKGQSDRDFWDTVGAEPIWTGNQKQNDSSEMTRRSGVYMWPGGLVAFENILPFHRVEYNFSIPLRDRIDTVLDWFLSDNYPINFCALYYPEPDSTGHHSGPESENIRKMLKYLDDGLGYLLQQLEKHKLLHRMNIILTSDHGMAPASNDSIIALSDYVDTELIDIYTSASPVPHIWPKQGQLETVYNALKDKHPHMKVFKKDEIPTEYHYSNNPRIPPILIQMDLGWNIVFNETDKKQWTNLGNHGYNNSLAEMHPLFIASGPAFKENYIAPQIRNIDIYPLLCHILQIKPRNNNGTMDRVENMLRIPAQFQFSLTAITFILAISLSGCVAVLFCIAVWRLKSMNVSGQWMLRHHVRLDELNQRSPQQMARLLEDSEEENFP
ncbi:unnamed protein product, partial [Owenia fusiformis]